MPIKQRVNGMGMNTPMANVIVGTVSAGLTAAGTTQGTALTLTLEDNHIFTTVAAGTGAVIQAGQYAPGDHIRVANYGANALAVYPASGGKISNGSANAAVSIPVNGEGIFTSINGTDWFSLITSTGGSVPPAVAFRVYNASDISVPIGNGPGGNGGYAFYCDTADFDTDSQINFSTSTPAAAYYDPMTAFICSNAGYYYFQLIMLLTRDYGAAAPEPSNIFTATLTHYDTGGSFLAQFDGHSAYVSLYPVSPFSGGMTVSVSQVIYCTAGDYVLPFFQRNFNETSTAMLIVGGFDSYFSGFKIGD